MTELIEPPASDYITDHDRAHLTTYLRILDGVADGADLVEIASAVLGVDMERYPARRYRLLAAYRARAGWMTEHGYRELAGFGAP